MTACDAVDPSSRSDAASWMRTANLSAPVPCEHLGRALRAVAVLRRSNRTASVPPKGDRTPPAPQCAVNGHHDDTRDALANCFAEMSLPRLLHSDEAGLASLYAKGAPFDPIRTSCVATPCHKSGNWAGSPPGANMIPPCARPEDVYPDPVMIMRNLRSALGTPSRACSGLGLGLAGARHHVDDPDKAAAQAAFLMAGGDLSDICGDLGQDAHPDCLLAILWPWLICQSPQPSCAMPICGW